MRPTHVPGKGMGNVIIDVRNAAMALDLQLPGREFVEGSVIDAVVHGLAAGTRR